MAADGADARAVKGDDHVEYGAVLNERQTRMLKIAIAAMAVAILIAIAGVIAGMVYRASLIGKSTEKTRGVAGRPVDVALPLPEGASIRSSQLTGNRLVVHYEGPAGAGIAVVDIATGEVVGRVRIQRTASDGAGPSGSAVKP